MSSTTFAGFWFFCDMYPQVVSDFELKKGGDGTLKFS